MHAWHTHIQAVSPRTNSCNIFAKVIQLVWQIVLGIWKLWNSHLHPPQTTCTDQSQVQLVVEQIFHKTSTDPNLQALLTHTTIEHIMSWPTKYIQCWITTRYNHIQAHKEAATRWHRWTHMTFNNFSNPHSTLQNHAHPARTYSNHHNSLFFIYCQCGS